MAGSYVFVLDAVLFGVKLFLLLFFFYFFMVTKGMVSGGCLLGNSFGFGYVSMMIAITLKKTFRGVFFCSFCCGVFRKANSN